MESICFQINSIYDKLNTKELQNVREKGIAIDDRFETVFSKSFRILRKILDEHKSCDQDVIEISSDEDSPSIELIKPPMNEKSNEEIKQELLAASKDSMLEDINAMFSK